MQVQEETKKAGLSKNTIIIIAVIAVLLPAVVILAVLNRAEMTERLTYHVEGSFRVISGEEYSHVSLEDLVNMSPANVSSSPRGERRDFTGVSLADILEFSGLDYSYATSIMFISIDGFRTAISLAEALNAENAFIVFEEDGVALGERPDLFSEAPFMLVMAQDPFPNRWARYVFEIILQ